jgi:hypothetical protein
LRTAVQQLLFDLLFTWPADQPRHAARGLDIPDRNRIAPRTPSFYPTAELPAKIFRIPLAIEIGSCSNQAIAELFAFSAV